MRCDQARGLGGRGRCMYMLLEECEYVEVGSVRDGWMW